MSSNLCVIVVSFTQCLTHCQRSLAGSTGRTVAGTGERGPEGGAQFAGGGAGGRDAGPAPGTMRAAVGTRGTLTSHARTGRPPRLRRARLGLRRPRRRALLIEQARRDGPAGGIRIADELRRQVLAMHPDWPSQRERDEDLATHLRVIDALRRVPARSR